MALQSSGSSTTSSTVGSSTIKAMASRFDVLEKQNSTPIKRPASSPSIRTSSKPASSTTLPTDASKITSKGPGIIDILTYSLLQPMFDVL